ncbi:MAG: Ig-like domain-containing domain [Bacteroidota bacterium]|nr:Ig-like domain-containing domain [Bacteroidota bacterium]
MKTSIIRSLIFFSAAYIYASGCAKISSPSGGPKDKEPPVVIRSIPENGTVNFKGREIVISFNEYVVLDRITEKFMVSPPLKKRPEVFTRGKSIHVKFDEELRDSATYTFYFQDAIRDLNEGNPINNYQFVFSTGPVIDSLSVTGNVYTGLTLDPPENAMVLLYSNPADSAVIKKIPDYITRSEQNGEFRISNVSPGRYRLYGLVDADNSKNYNNRDEAFAFYPEAVDITPQKNFLPVVKDTAKVKPVEGKIPFKPPLIGEYQLIMFQAEKKARYLTSSSRKDAYHMVYTLSVPPDTLKFSFRIPDTSPDAYYIEKNRTKDTVTVWLTDSTLYHKPQIETIVSFPFTDSLGVLRERTDTVTMRYLAPKLRGKTARHNAYKISTGIMSQVRPDKKITITAPAPFLPPDTSKIRLFELEKEQKIRRLFNLSKDTTNSCRYYAQADLKPGRSYLFISDSAAFKSIYGEASDSTGIRFSVLTPETYGKLILDISGYEGNTIIQLLNNTEKVVRESHLTGKGKIEFPLLEQGGYRIRAIFDLNNDGKWTTGDFDSHRQPEPVSYYPEELEIRANWEATQPWNLELNNFKNPKLQIIKKSTR